MLKRLIIVCLALLPVITCAQSAASKYIDAYKKEAIEKMNKYGIPASVILGVAMHESGSGTSKVSRYLNNHFGMKGANKSREIKSSYKGYDSVSASYEDFVTLLKSRLSFSSLFNKYSDHDYKSWAKGIQRGGYAKSRSWSAQVLGIINKYKLYELDNRPSGDTLLVSASDDNDEAVMSPPPAAARTYRVKRGDTLRAIAKKFGTSVQTIRKKNGLISANLQIGQRLHL